MNVALRLLMRKTGSAPNTFAPIRVAQVDNVTPGFTLNFTEPTALDNTHLLVAVGSASSTAQTVSGSWSLIGTGNGTVQKLRIWVLRGDGSTNGITFTAGGNGGVKLMAFSGYNGLTPIFSQLSTYSTSGTRLVPTSGTWTSPGGAGVSIAAFVPNTGGADTGSWTNGYSPVGAAMGTPPLMVATHAYSGSDPTTQGSPGGSATGSKGIVIMPLI